ncbi:MAG: SUMF1/EgtB/PvdO family nonheme iron enzyme [Rubripirellula sp.]
MSKDCLSEDQVNAFAIGAINHKMLHRFSSHLEQCSHCLSRLETVSKSLDTSFLQVAEQTQCLPFEDEEAFGEVQRAVAKLVIGDSSLLTSDGAEPTARQELGPYKLLHQIGRGGMGTVYAAVHEQLDRMVAIKLLPPLAFHRPDVVERFKREIQAIGRLKHPNIVSALDAGVVDGTYFLVMELIDGSDLASVLRHHGPLQVADACEVIRQAAVGLDEASRLDIVHRDIKPSNLMIVKSKTGSPIVKVLDLGLAKLPGLESEELTITGQIMGTIDYMSPEQCEDSHHVDERSDVYSMAATLYKLLTGQSPFGKGGPTRKLNAILSETAPLVSSHRSDIPDDVVRLIESALAKDPEDRPSSARELAIALRRPASSHDLRKLLDGLPLESQEPAAKDRWDSTLLGPLEPETSSSNKGIIGLSVVSTALLLVLIYMIWAPFNRSAPQHVESPVALSKSNQDPASASISPTEILTSTDWAWTEPKSLPRSMNESPQDAFLCPDGLEILALYRRDLLVSYRSDEGRDWGSATRVPLPGVLSGTMASPHLSLDQTHLLVSMHDEGADQADIWQANRNTESDSWSCLTKIEAPISTASSEQDAVLYADDQRLMFVSDRPGGMGAEDIWESQWDPITGAWEAPVPLSINGRESDCSPVLSSDGLVLLFVSNREASGSTGFRIWQSQRASQASTWEEPTQVSLPIETEVEELKISVTADNRTMLLWAAPVEGRPKMWISNRIHKEIMQKHLEQPSHSPPAMELGLVGMWTFDTPGSRTVHDRSGLGNHGQIQSEDMRAISGQGAPINASRHSFHGFGKDGAVEIDSLPSFDLNSGFSLAAFVRSVGVEGEDRVELFRGGDDLSGYSIGVMGEKSEHSRKLYFSIWQEQFPDQILLSVDRVSGGWGHFGVTVDGQEVILYRNGKMNSRLKLPNGFRIEAAKLQIGSPEFTGEIDEVCLYNRSLSNEEVASLTRSRPQASLVLGPESIARAKEIQETLARELDVPLEFTNHAGIRMRLIPAGDFLMGAGAIDLQEVLNLDKRKRSTATVEHSMPQQWVRISQPFYLSKCEITQSQYESVTGENTAHFRKDGRGEKLAEGLDTSSFPMDHATWNDAAAFCNLMNQEAGLPPCYQKDDDSFGVATQFGYHLPTEAQWEYACRAGTTTAWWYGNAADDSRPYSWNVINSKRRPSPVGTRKPNGFGLFDMHGNVREWCQDWSGPYTGGQHIDPMGPISGEKRILRGGSWWQRRIGSYSSFRFHHFPGFHYNEEGFRIVLSLDAAKQARQFLSVEEEP